MSECLIGESTTDTNGNTVCKVHDTTAVWGETRENTGKLKSEIPAQSVPEAKIAKVITPAPSEEEAVFTTPEDVAQPETKKELTFEQKIEKSKFLIGDAEWDFFVKHFFSESKVTPKDIIKKIQEIQTGHTKADGIIGPNTLKIIYTQYYAQNRESLPHLQHTRLQAYEEVGIQYLDWTREVKHLGTVTLRNRLDPIPIFDKNYYFGENEGIPQGYINADLKDIFPRNIEQDGVRAYLRKLDGKYMVAVYVDGEPKLASYASPGDFVKYGDDAITPKVKASFLKSDRFQKMHYISGARDSVAKTPNDDGSYDSDPMPYAVPIDPMTGVYSHAGKVDGKLRSHGCVRLPAHYARGVYEIFTTFGEITWDTYYEG